LAGSTRHKNETAGGIYSIKEEPRYHAVQCRTCGSCWQVFCSTNRDHGGDGNKVSNKPRGSWCEKGQGKCFNSKYAHISRQPYDSRSLEEGPFPDLRLITKPGGEPVKDKDAHRRMMLEKDRRKKLKEAEQRKALAGS
jgi:hypothetical protein